MRYLLDTNICVHFLRGAYNLDQKFIEVGTKNCFLSEITVLELNFGPENSDPAYSLKKRTSLEKFLTAYEDRVFTISECFKIYIQQRVKLRKMGTPISDFDLLIGSTAIANGLIMVTENTREFSRPDNIILENWIVRP